MFCLILYALIAALEVLKALHKAMEFGVNSVPSAFIDGHLLQGVYDPKALRSLLVNLEAGGATYPES